MLNIANAHVLVPADDMPMNRAATGVTTGYQFGQCMLSQMGAQFSYDHEYLGPQARLVFTPLTERAYLSLAVAMKSFSCGTLIGPQGTGKSETVRDLACVCWLSVKTSRYRSAASAGLAYYSIWAHAITIMHPLSLTIHAVHFRRVRMSVLLCSAPQAMGRHIVSINCSEEMTLQKMNQYLVGMIQSGSWALFDDTDRMTKGTTTAFTPTQFTVIKSSLASARQNATLR